MNGKSRPPGQLFLFLKTCFKNNKIMKQMYFAEQTLEGDFVIVRYDNRMQYLIPLRGERYATVDEAIARARQLNEEYFAEAEGSGEKQS